MVVSREQKLEASYVCCHNRIRSGTSCAVLRRKTTSNQAAIAHLRTLKQNHHGIRHRNGVARAAIDNEASPEQATTDLPQPSSATAVSEPASAASPEPPLPGEKVYRGLALASVSAAVGLFVLTRVAGAGTDLSALAARSANFDEAMGNGRPTVVEFYADWCQVRLHHACVVLTESHRVMLNAINSAASHRPQQFTIIHTAGSSHLPKLNFIIHNGSIMAFDPSP
ncbi:unnamed protein product [Closterium sp. Yama58-4]|nr:unnamed protein product [Closterium sp. Yama58-4]